MNPKLAIFLAVALNLMIPSDRTVKGTEESDLYQNYDPYFWKDLQQTNEIISEDAEHQDNLATGLSRRQRQSSMSQEEEEEESKGQQVLGSVQGGLTLYTNPQTVLNYITNLIVAYGATQLAWIMLNLLFWDYSTTTPAEELTIANLVNYLANTDVAVYTFLLVWTSSLFISAFLLLPTVILNAFPSIQTSLIALGKKRRKKRSNWFEKYFYTNTDITSRTTPTWTEGNFMTAIRAVICPFCIVRLITFNTIVFLAQVTLFSLTPYLRGKFGIPAGNAAGGKKRRKREPSEEEDVDLGLVQGVDPVLLQSLESTVYKALEKFDTDPTVIEFSTGTVAMA